MIPRHYFYNACSGRLVYNVFSLVQCRIPSRKLNQVMAAYVILYCTMLPDFCLNELYILYSKSRDLQEHNPFLLLCLLPGDPCSTKRVGIGSFFLHNTVDSQFARMIPEIPLTPWPESMVIFYWFWETFLHHKIVVNPENKMSLKISVSFLSVVNSFAASTNKKKETGEWGIRRKKKHLLTWSFPQHTTKNIFYLVHLLSLLFKYFKINFHLNFS